MNYKLEFSEETKEKIRIATQGPPRPRSIDFRAMSDERLDDFIAANSHTMFIVAATDERKRRAGERASREELERYKATNRLAVIAIWIAIVGTVVASAIAVLAWLYPRAPIDEHQQPVPAHQQLAAQPAAPAVPAKETSH